MQERAIIIVGSGPAGISTALSIKRVAPHLADELLVLEKARHPRPKLCGGGLTQYATELLRSLDLQIQSPSFRVHKVRFYLHTRPIHVRKPNIIRIIRRDEFDAELVRHATERGIHVHENEAVVDIKRRNGFLEVATQKDLYKARVVVGADGAKSVVRRKLIREGHSRVSRLMEVLVRVDESQTPEFSEQMAVFDFRGMRDHLQGYQWDFPCYVDGQAHLNIGIFDSRILPGQRANLKDSLLERLRRRGIAPEQVTFLGHPERWFSRRGRYAQPNVLLVGDAAGIEPLFGEGISVALAYGPVAARAIKHAFENGDFGFHTYKRLILRNRLGRILTRNRFVARHFYARKNQRLLSGLASVAAFCFNARWALSRGSGSLPN